MTTEELGSQLSLGEGQRLEFKQDAIKPGDLAETLVALANAQGGLVLIGVSDAGVPVGVRSYEQAYDLVMTAASYELCDPPVPLTQVEPVAVAPGLQVLAVTVPRSHRLHATHGRFLVRRGSRNVSLTTAEVADRSRHLATGSLSVVQLGRGYEALYEVRRFEATLELLDENGQGAVLERDQHIRFLQDGVVGLYHQIWGEGELFDEYDVQPGIVADRFQVGSRHITLISLRQIKNRGDQLQMRIRRRIRHGWTQSQEWLELAVDHRTRLAQARVICPRTRPPHSAWVMEVSTGRTHEINQSLWQVDDHGRTVIVWRKPNPRLGETYVLRWEW